MDIIDVTSIDKTIQTLKKGGIVSEMPSSVKKDLADFEEELKTTKNNDYRIILEKAIAKIHLEYPTKYPKEAKQNEIDKIDGSINQLFGGNWFKNNPSKLLGEAIIGKDRYGKEIELLSGDISVLSQIRVNDNFAQFEKDLGIGTSDIKPSIDDLLSAETTEGLIENIIKKSEAEIGRKAVKQKVRKEQKNNEDYDFPTHNIQSYKIIADKLNKDISDEEVKAYVWYKEEIGQTLSSEWYELAYKNTDSRTKEEMILDWVNNGILFYINGELLPKPIFASGDIYQKISRLVKSGDNSGQDIEYIKSTYGDSVLKKHLEVLNDSFKKVYDKRLIITGNEKGNSLVLKPISKFSTSFMISKTESNPEGFKWWASGKKDTLGQPDFNKTSGSNWNKKEFEQLTLTQAFAMWMLEKGSHKLGVGGNITVQDIIYFYIDKRTKQAPSHLSDVQKESFKAQMQRTKSKAMSEGNRLFLIFLKEELDLNQKVTIEQTWNSQFNNYLAPNYNEIPVAFNVTNNFFDEEPFVIKQEKRDAVSFIFNEGSGCLAYDVGVGKTIALLMVIEQFIVAGYSKRPFIVVPNQTYKQWLSEIKNLLPHRNINGLYNLGVDYIDEVMDENGEVKMIEEGSISVMTYEGFKNLGFNEETQNQTMSELYDILNQGGADEVMSEKKKAGFYEKLETLIGRGLKGTNVEIEKLGFDFISFDEAHALKKVFTSIKGESTDGKKGKKQYSIQSGTPSDTALKGFMISQYILRNNNYRNVVLLTATPFTNSPLEVFSMLSLIAYHHLDKLGLKNINDFFDNYIDVSTELVINHKLQPQYKQVIKGFNNLASLQRIILRFFDYKSGEDVGVIRPNKIVIPYVKKLVDGKVVDVPKDEEVTSNIEMSPLQQKYMDGIVAYAEGKGEIEEMFDSIASFDTYVSAEMDDADAETFSDEALDSQEKAGVKALRSMNFSRNLALSPYLFEYSGLGEPTYLEYINTSPKLKYVMECIRSVKNYHIEHNEPISGQVIYMDRGLKYFGLMKEYLINELGFERHEIGMITAKVSVENKRKTQDAFLGVKYNEKTQEYDAISDDERIKVVLGSSSIKEGINLQKKSTVLYNCFLDWNPTDMIQLQGRIWRQKNEFMNVRIVNPLMIDSIDIFMFQKLEEKTARLNTIWSNNGESVLKIEEIDPIEIKRNLIKDPFVLAKLESEILGSKIIDDLSSLKSINERLDNYLLAYRGINERKQQISDLLDIHFPSKKDLDTFSKLAFLISFYKKDNPKDEKGRVLLSRYDRNYNMTSLMEKFAGEEFSTEELETKPYWFTILVDYKRQMDKDKRDLLEPRNIESIPEHIKNYIETSNVEIEKLEAQKDFLNSEEYVEKRTQEIIQDRLENKFEIKSIEKLVDEFGRFNHLLSLKRPKSPKKESKVTYESCEVYNEKGERKIDADTIAKLTKCVESLPQTKQFFVDENGEYTESRKEVHKEIINKVKGDVRCIETNEPIAILTGGSPASGKSSFLRHYAPFLMNTEIFKIDADDIRAMLPEYKGWNATATHLETKDIINTLLTDKEIGIPCQFDIIYDGTMNSTKNYLPLIGLLKRLGYKVFIVYMDNVPYKEIKQRMLERYKKSGRFVPIQVIDDFFTKGKSALNELKTKVDGYMVVDANTRDYNIIEEGGMKLPTERDYNKIGKTFTVEEARIKLDKSSGKSVKIEEHIVEKTPNVEDLEKRLKVVRILAKKNPILKVRIKIIEKMIANSKNKMAEGGEVSNELKNFNLDDLDIMEDFHYKHFSKNMPKEDALQVIINSVEGDYSQLSDKLRQIAEKQQPIAG
jgi:predicted ABC-type ATPase